jgi:pSer/pThr/pTyr-binding forkhead associated (FHA) protein
VTADREERGRDAPHAIIEILSGDLEGRAYDIDEAPFAIGRKEDCAIVIPKKYVSRRHAEIVEKDGRYVVRGLSEKNPIVADGEEVTKLSLEDGSEFEICGIKFRFRARGRGASREERAAQRQASPVGSAVGSAKTKAYRKDAISRAGDDIEDGPLPGDEDTKQYDERSSGEAAKKSGEASKKGGEGSKKGGEGSKKSGEGSKKSGEPAPRSGSGPTRSGAGSGEEWRPDPKEGPRERIVFDDDPGPSSGTGKTHKSSGDDKEERTDQIDISKFKTDDPFAEQKKERTPEELAAREKFIKALVAVGVVGILCAGGLVWYLQGPPPKKIIDIEFHASVAVNEVRRFDEPLNERDPPNVVRSTPVDGTAADLITTDDPNIATVEWAVPGTQSTAYFLVHGVSPGDTTFMIWLKSGNGRRYHIRVEGISKHEQLKKARMDKLAALTVDDLKKEINDRIVQGEELDKAILTPSPKQERYPRQAVHVYELAQEALDALQKLIDKSGQTDPDFDGMRESVHKHHDRAEESWRNLINQKKKSYDLVVEHAQWDEAVHELQGLLWLVGDSCDQNVMRWDLLLEKVYYAKGYRPSSDWRGPECIEEQR